MTEQTEISGWSKHKTMFPWFPFNEPLTVLKEFAPIEVKLPNGQPVFGITTLERGTVLMYPKQLCVVADAMLREGGVKTVIVRKIKDEYGTTIVQILPELPDPNVKRI